jgi:nitrite reductase (NADH) small subunit
MSREHLIGRHTDFHDRECRVFRLGDVEIGVLRLGERFFAYENVCPHQGGPVCEGLVLGKVEAVVEADRTISGERFSGSRLHIVCPWHGFEYDATTGRCAADARLGLRPFEVREREGDVYVIA